MKKFQTFLIAMTATTLSGCGGTTATAPYPSDTLALRDGSSVEIGFLGHASLLLHTGGKYIYVDPVGGAIDYSTMPKADVILITHSHYDHLDTVALTAVRTPQTEILCDHTSAETLGDGMTVMWPGSKIKVLDNISVETVAAYNTTEGHLQFHPKEREDCGYLLTLGGSRIYIAGDTEPTPELLALRDIDVAFLPVNQPYTMTVDQAVEAVKAIRPTIFYPYHYGGVPEKTDIARLAEELEGITEVRIRPME